MEVVSALFSAFFLLLSLDVKVTVCKQTIIMLFTLRQRGTFNYILEKENVYNEYYQLFLLLCLDDLEILAFPLLF